MSTKDILEIFGSSTEDKDILDLWGESTKSSSSDSSSDSILEVQIGSKLAKIKRDMERDRKQREKEKQELLGQAPLKQFKGPKQIGIAKVGQLYKGDKFRINNNLVLDAKKDLIAAAVDIRNKDSDNSSDAFWLLNEILPFNRVLKNGPRGERPQREIERMITRIKNDIIKLEAGNLKRGKRILKKLKVGDFTLLYWPYEPEEEIVEEIVIEPVGPLKKFVYFQNFDIPPPSLSKKVNPWVRSDRKFMDFAPKDISLTDSVPEDLRKVVKQRLFDTLVNVKGLSKNEIEEEIILVSGGPNKDKFVKDKVHELVENDEIEYIQDEVGKNIVRDFMATNDNRLRAEMIVYHYKRINPKIFTKDTLFSTDLPIEKRLSVEELSKLLSKFTDDLANEKINAKERFRMYLNAEDNKEFSKLVWKEDKEVKDRLFKLFKNGFDPEEFKNLLEFYDEKNWDNMIKRYRRIHPEIYTRIIKARMQHDIQKGSDSNIAKKYKDDHPEVFFEEFNEEQKNLIYQIIQAEMFAEIDKKVEELSIRLNEGDITQNRFMELRDTAFKEYQLLYKRLYPEIFGYQVAFKQRKDLISVGLLSILEQKADMKIYRTPDSNETDFISIDKAIYDEIIQYPLSENYKYIQRFGVENEIIIDEFGQQRQILTSGFETELFNAIWRTVVNNKWDETELKRFFVGEPQQRVSEEQWNQIEDEWKMIERTDPKEYELFSLEFSENEDVEDAQRTLKNEVEILEEGFYDFNELSDGSFRSVPDSPTIKEYVLRVAEFLSALDNPYTHNSKERILTGQLAVENLWMLSQEELLPEFFLNSDLRKAPKDIFESDSLEIGVNVFNRFKKWLDILKLNEANIILQLWKPQLRKEWFSVPIQPLRFEPDNWIVDNKEICSNQNKLYVMTPDGIKCMTVDEVKSNLKKLQKYNRKDLKKLL